MQDACFELVSTGLLVESHYLDMLGRTQRGAQVQVSAV
jgi:hypothetical protein